MRASDVAFITKFWKCVGGIVKTWNSDAFLHKNLFPRQKGKKAKKLNTRFKANQPEMRPKKPKAN